jgi:hypothetical protein
MADFGFITQFAVPIVAVIVPAAIFFFFRGAQESNLVPFSGLDASRSRVLQSLAKVNPSLAEFYSVVRNPEETLKKAGTPGFLFTVVTIGPFVLLFAILLWEAIGARDLISPLFTFVYEMELLAFPVAILTPKKNTGVFLKFWKNIDPKAPRRAWTILFYLFRISNDMVGYFAMGIGLTIFALALAAFTRKDQVLTQLVSGTDPYGFMGGIIADIAAVLVFRLVYFGGIHQIENFAFESYRKKNNILVELTLRSARKGDESKERGEVLEIGSSLIMKRNDGYTEGYRWQDILRIASKGEAKLDASSAHGVGEDIPSHT